MGAATRRLVLGLLVALAAAASASSARAATVAYLSDAQLASRASRIVHGRVAVLWTEADASGLVRTVARLEVDEDLTGVDEPSLEVEQLGGAFRGVVLAVPGEPGWSEGDEIVACLERSPRQRRWRLLALGFALFGVERDGRGAAAGGGALLRRHDAGLRVLGRPDGPAPDLTLEGFRAIVRSTRGTRPVRPQRRGAEAPSSRAAAAPLAATSIVSANFTLLGGGVRWNEVDAGARVQWYRNPSAPAPVDGSDGEAEIRTALSAWSTAPGAVIPLAYGGVRSIGGDSVWCGPSNLGAGLITFEDPTSELASGIIALGGGCTSVVGRRTVNGTVFDSFTHGFVILNRSVEVGPVYRTPLNFARIIEHEVGHGIGLGHTPTGSAGAQANIMYPSCCSTLTPVPPALGADDAAGVRFIYPAPLTPGDTDGDGLPDTWETLWGLDPASAAGDAGAAGDPDGDGLTNLQEFQGGSHPRGFHRYWFAEGAHSTFFFPQIRGVVPGSRPAALQLRTFADPPRYACNVATRWEPRRPASLAPDLCIDEEWASSPVAMASLLESDEPLVAERVMSWPYSLPGGATAGGRLGHATLEAYGAHAETAVEAPSRTWFFAEGATHSDFDLFFLVFNTEDRAVTVTATYRRPAPLPPVTRSYHVEPRTRRTIWVDVEEPDLSSTDVAASFDADGAIVVERSMYRSSPGSTFLAGHGAAGVAAPSTRWWFAEGATGTFFETFLLLSNPTAGEAHVTARYVLSTGEVVERPVAVPAESRVTMRAGTEDPRLESAAFGIEVSSDNGVPVVAERAMWWPGPTPDAWLEAHVTAGALAVARRWVTADGEAGGERGARTYLLVLNPAPEPLELEVVALFEDGNEASTSVTAAARARTTLDMAAVLPATLGRRFAAEVAVLTPDADGVVVERATYWDSVLGPWSAGVVVRATPR